MNAKVIAAGSPARKAADDAFWNTRYALVEELDGNVAGLVSATVPA